MMDLFLSVYGEVLATATLLLAATPFFKKRRTLSLGAYIQSSKETLK